MHKTGRHNLPVIIFIIALLSSCVPVNSSFESARMLDKNQMEFKGNYAHYLYADNGNVDVPNDNYGIGVGYGISKTWNIKSVYELLILPTDPDPVHYAGIIPKYSILQNKLAAELPLSFYAGNDIDELTWVISPRIIGTWPFSNKFELSASMKTDFFFEDNADIPLGFNLGAGFSSNLDQWALRPETGFMINTEGEGIAYFFGLGYTFNIQFSSPNIPLR